MLPIPPTPVVARPLPLYAVGSIHSLDLHGFLIKCFNRSTGRRLIIFIKDHHLIELVDCVELAIVEYCLRRLSRPEEHLVEQPDEMKSGSLKVVLFREDIIFLFTVLY
jgi:hypothetical protein